MRTRKFLLICFLLQVFCAHSFAQNTGSFNEQRKIEITAAEALEWDRTAKTYTAKEDAVAIYQELTVRGDLLRAYYREDEAGRIILTRMQAMGDPEAVFADDKIVAQEMTAFLNEDGSIDRIEAQDNVVITTAEEKAEGDFAVYRPETEIAILRGNVALRKGENVLLGEQAEVDMLNNVSRLFANDQTSPQDDTPKAGQSKKRVRGVFYLDEVEQSE